MHVFRLMGMPDKVIAFEGLPDDLVEGFEMIRADGFPRHWKEWMGKKRKVTQIPPERDFLTGGVRRFPPIVEEAEWFYLVDYLLQPSIERWEKVCSYIRQNVQKDFRLLDKIDDMALPLAADKSSSVTLDPEEVVIIKLKPQEQKLEAPKKEEKPSYNVKCDECSAEFDGPYAKNALRLHKAKKHAKEKVS